MTSGRVYDASPANVSGRVRSGRARVVWRDGRLIVAAGARQQITAHVFDAPDPPAVSGGTWSTAGVSWRTGGCNCGFAVGKMSRAALLRTIDRMIDAGDITVAPADDGVVAADGR